MPENIDKTVSEHIYLLQKSFQERLPARISELEQEWKRILDNGAGLNDMQLKTHSLTGTAATYTAIAIAETSRSLEALLKLRIKEQLEHTADFINQVDGMLIDLKQQAAEWQPSKIPFVPESENQVKQSSNWKSTIALVEDDESLVQATASFLENAGYTVIYYKNIQQFEKEYPVDVDVAAIMMDLEFNQGRFAGAECIKRLSEEQADFPPVVFISVHNDMEARLAAVRAGAEKYFTKPLNEQNIIHTLDSLTERLINEPYRVLIVDDDQEALNYYSDILLMNQFDVQASNDSMKAYELLESYNPDVIVLDLYMPGCSGTDLAKIIRQNDGYANVPIVFLSSELDTQTQLAAMNLGGDDFISKPVEENQFIQAIQARVKRSRHVNELNNELQDALRESEYRLISLDKHAIVCMADSEGNLTSVNNHFTNISGYSIEELRGQSLASLASDKYSQQFYQSLWSEVTNGNVWHGQISYSAKDKHHFWLEVTIVPFIGTDGVPYKYTLIGTDITSIKISEEEALAAERRLLEQQQTLTELAMDGEFISLRQADFFAALTRRVADSLNVARVGIWMFSSHNQLLVCNKLYQRDKNEWSEGKVIERAGCPNYFDVLESNASILTYNAQKDPATIELAERYLIPENIYSTLNLPIRRQGKLIGVVSCENKGEKRDWYSDEVSFVSGIADLVSLNIATHERQMVEQALIQAKKEADSANQAKSEFLSNMSHEFRTPLNAVSGFAQLLAMNDEGNLSDVQLSNIDEIARATNHLLSLINDLLDLTKIESGAMQLKFENAKCVMLFAECMNLLSTLVQQRQLVILYKLQGKGVPESEFYQNDATIFVDPTRLRQVILNLLGNAIKYNNTGGSLTLECEKRDNGNARLSISDSGNGISEKDQKDLFKAFNRLGREGSDIEGTGIGLVIARDLVLKMNGEIGFASVMGEGSTFWVEFPVVE